MTVRKSPPAWVVGSIGFVIVAAFALRILIPTGMDPTVFLALGEESPIQTAYARRLAG